MNVWSETKTRLQVENQTPDCGILLADIQRAKLVNQLTHFVWISSIFRSLLRRHFVKITVRSTSKQRMTRTSSLLRKKFTSMFVHDVIRSVCFCLGLIALTMSLGQMIVRGIIRRAFWWNVSFISLILAENEKNLNVRKHITKTKLRILISENKLEYLMVDSEFNEVLFFKVFLLSMYLSTCNQMSIV